ncbi:MAG: potassium channel family protein [Bacteroidetes bacterium]|nr:potassium channel family protein [Bacteroidota bacterium]
MLLCHLVTQIMTFRFKTREVLLFILVSLGVYMTFIFGFAWIYYNTGSIEMTPYSTPYNHPGVAPVSNKINFEKAVYFSIVSFHTIGFGDIHPVTQLGRQIVMIQSTISLFFTSIFSGFLVYFVIKRPQDVFTTKKVYIRKRDGNYYLSLRLGNKGRDIIDLKSKFEAWTIENNTRVRAFRIEEELADLEKILYYDLNLDEPGRLPLRRAISSALGKGPLLHMKFSFIGNDIKTGEQVAYAKYYDSRHLSFGKRFLNVYSWDPNGRRRDFHWGNFEKIEPMEKTETEEFYSITN